MKKNKKISPAKPEVKKDAESLLPSFQNISIEASPPIIPANISMNLNSELEVILKGKIKLDQLLLITDEFRKKILGGNQNFVDLFFLNKKFLDVYQVESKVDTIDYCSSYTTKGFDISEEKLIPVRTIKTNSDYKIKILQVKDSKNNNYVLKRCWASLKIGSLTFEEFREIIIFLIDKYTEYAVNKLYYACPYSAKPAGYHIIQLTNNATNQMMLVTEMLSVFAGIPLSNVFPINDTSNILDYFIQILHSGNFLEAYKIEHNDIKPDNFLIEFLDKLALIKLIDFDIGTNQPQDLPTNRGLGCRSFTAGYVAPEILRIVQSGLEPEVQKQMLSQLNPWKSHSYSIGILMLQMIGFIPKIMQLREFDPLKKIESDYNQILSKLNEYYLKETDLILKNIIHLISLCLIYNQEHRASVKEILTLIEHIEQKNSDSILAEWNEIKTKREPSRAALKVNKKELENEINLLQMKNKYLNDDRNSLIQSLKNRFPDANISFNDNLCAKTWEIINWLSKSFGLQINAKENEINQLRSAVEKSLKENRVLFETNAFLENDLDLRTKELNESQKNSALKDAQILILNQKVQENEDMIKIQENNIHETETENMKLKNELNDIKLKIKEYEANEKLLKDQGIQYQKQLLQKDNIIQEISKERNHINEELNSEKNNSNENISKIQKVIEEQNEMITKLKDEISQKEHSYQLIESKFQNFCSNMLKIIQEKGFKIVDQNKPIEEILNILKKLLPKATNEKIGLLSIDNQCKICGKVQNYQEMKTCIISSPKLNKKLYNEIKENDRFWKLYDSQFKIDEMILFKPLISISIQLELIDLRSNSDFNFKCLEMLIEAIESNQSLKAIALFKNHHDIQINHYKNLLEITKTKTNLISLYLDKKIIPKEKAKNMCIQNQYKMEINKWESKNDYYFYCDCVYGVCDVCDDNCFI